MPVSPIPLLFPVLLICVPLLFLIKGRKPFLLAAAGSALIVLCLFLWVYIPGWILMCRWGFGDPAAMYELARWTENHHERIGEFILWPYPPDVLGGYAWLEKSAALEYPPAVYAVGVRLKYGIHVPEPLSWTGAGGNVFEQPARGQALIDKAIRLGYRPTLEEKSFYHQYRN